MLEQPLVPEPIRTFPRLQEKEGLLSWVATVDHKLLGIMYCATAVIFFIVGGVEALLMRIQLGSARNTFLSPQAYNQVFTMHGTTMIFLVVVPLMLGFGVYLIPLQIGARDMAFPRLNAFGFWMLAFGGILLYYSFIAGDAPSAGWFSDQPLGERAYNTGPGMNYWALGLLLTGIGTTSAGINFIITVLTMRAPGMRFTQIPMFTFSSFVNAFLIIGALPPLNAALVMFLADRLLNGHFFTPQSGGSSILWQHYFWTFGHPEVYIMVLPAFGMISEVLPVFSRKPLFGYAFVAGSTVAVAFLSFTTYGHHMLVVGLGPVFELLFAASTQLIAIPTGIKIFNWIATMWGGKLRFTTSMLFAISFIVLFTIGGISGVTFAIVPTDWQTSDTYYVVAHMHYVLFGGTLFAVLGGTYYWFPKASGRMLSERLGKWHFWLTFIGFNMAFFIQHFLGLMGMPRRVYSYEDLPLWSFFNLISTIGTVLIGIGFIVFLVNVFLTLSGHGQKAGDNPWDAWTLEWATSSPPPIHNFDRIPPVRSRRPLWDLKHPEDPDWKRSHERKQGGILTSSRDKDADDSTRQKEE
jgi:cytochrome c oxidase subunit I